MTEGEAATELLAGMKQAGINFVTTLPDINLLALITLLEQDQEITHVPLCREEEGIGICAGAFLVGRRVAIIMQNGGLLNSCNGIATTALQFEIPMVLMIYYAGDAGDRGFATVGAVTEPVLRGLGLRTFILREPEKIVWTLKGALTLAEDSRRPVAVLLTKDVLGRR